MNKSDFKLIRVILLLVFLMFSYFILTKENNDKVAKVFYKNELMLEIDMQESIKKQYEVDATLGNVIIEYDNGKIRVKEETSPRNLCSKQGFIQESYETIICLPNELVVIIEAKNSLDTVIR